MKYSLSSGVWIALISACSHNQPDPRDSNYELLNDRFAERQVVASITDQRLNEASGLELSIANPGYFWMHNDSGDTANLYLVARDGSIAMTVLLEGIYANDWEEMSLAVHDSIPYLYIGDTGDNPRKREQVTIHRIPEPVFDGATEDLLLPDSLIESLTFSYKEGPKDVEAFFYDPFAEKITIVTKREESCLIYAFDFEPEKSPLVIESLGTIDLRNFTSADINDKGEILLKNYPSIFYWSADPSPAAERMLLIKPARIPYEPEPQGEALCWDEVGGFYSISEFNEGFPQNLYYYPPR